jgi:hypothetical protein
MYIDKQIVKYVWDDLYDHNMKLWKVSSLELGMRFSAGARGLVLAKTANQMWDLQNDHLTFGWSATRDGRDRVVDDEVPKQYDDVRRYSDPSGLSQIMK